jgi:hypothetical protein
MKFTKARSGCCNLRRCSVKQSKMRNFTFDAPWPEKIKEHKLESVKQGNEMKNEGKNSKIIVAILYWFTLVNLFQH